MPIANVCLQHKSTFGVHYRTGSPGQLGLRVAGFPGHWVSGSQNVTQFHVWGLTPAVLQQGWSHRGLVLAAMLRVRRPDWARKQNFGLSLRLNLEGFVSSTSLSYTTIVLLSWSCKMVLVTSLLFINPSPNGSRSLSVAYVFFLLALVRAVFGVGLVGAKRSWLYHCRPLGCRQGTVSTTTTADVRLQRQWQHGRRQV